MFVELNEKKKKSPECLKSLHEDPNLAAAILAVSLSERHWFDSTDSSGAGKTELSSIREQRPHPQSLNRNVRLPVPVTAGPYYSGSQPTTAQGSPTADLPNYGAKEIANEENTSCARKRPSWPEDVDKWRQN